MTRSLRSRLIVGMLLGMAVLLLAADTTIYTVQRRQLYRAFDDTLLSSANALVLLVHPGPFGYWFDSEGLARLLTSEIRPGALFQFWSDQPIDILPPRPGPDSMPSEPGPPGPAWEDRPPPEPGFRGPEPPPGPPPFRPPPEDAGPLRGRAPGELVVRSPLLNGRDLPRLDTPSGQARFEKIMMPGGGRGRAVGVQLQFPARGPGPRRLPPVELTIVVAASTVETEKQLSFLGALLAATALGTMAISGGVSWLVVSRGLRPLATVARKIAAMDETGLKQRLLGCGVPREIEPVVDQLNGLLGRLDEAFERERALTADVAHELRTPVAEVRTITEITLSRQRDPDEYRQALAETLDVIRTLQGLIEKLLVLARLEAGQMQAELQSVPLQPLLAEHWAQVRNRAAARGVTFEDRCPPEALVSADPKLLEVVLANVLSNAATYTPDGGRISAEAERVRDQHRLSIANTGCELSEGEVARVFDRFWRADAARGKSGLNCGLGLTLVRRAMEAMGGQAVAGVSQERCFVLTLTFQAAEGLG
jgi:signal transduction histidine kinase